MRILSRRVYAGNDFLVKMWAAGALLILAVAAALMWNDRFRESAETGIARISVFGVEENGREAANFTGSRGFFSKMNKMGLPAGTRRAELAALFEELGAAGTLPPDCGAVPVLWIYAEGLTKEDRDRCVQTYGKVFFEKSRFCFSVVDGNGFAVQLDPDTFRVLWAREGGAVCALPLLQLPEGNAARRGFIFRVEERGADGGWALRGEIRIPFSAAGTLGGNAADEDDSENFEDESDAENVGADGVPAANEDEISPEEISVEGLVFPDACRFFSAPLWERAAFGELRVKIRGNASGKVPAAAWTLENFGLRSPVDGAAAQVFPLTRADAFHKNVRFLENEIFEDSEKGVLRVPVAKSLFPARGNGGENAPLRVDMRFVRGVFFPEDFHALPPFRVGKNASVLPETFSAGEASAKIRAFRDENYFRALNGKPPAVVLEIDCGNAADAPFFWTPYRVKTDAGEELFPESVVDVRPGARQYWFLPRRSVPAKIEAVFAVTRCVYASGVVVPTLRERAADGVSSEEKKSGESVPAAP